MQGSHTLSNACTNDFIPVYNSYGDVELNGEEIVVQKAILQVFGNIKNNGVIIPPSEFDSHPLLSKTCDDSQIVVYPFADDVQPSNIFDGDLEIYPNPVIRKWRVKSPTITGYELYRDSDGELISWNYSLIATDFSFGMSGLELGTYTFKSFHSDGTERDNTFTQVEN